MAKILFDCSYGVSGDMIVGALLDLGADKDVLQSQLKSLKLGDYRLKITRLDSATDFDVILATDNHDHDMQYLYGNKEANMKMEEPRTLSKVAEIIENSSLSQKAKSLAMEIFEVVAESEGKAHGIDKNEVIFHERGAMDSIIDIASIAICIDNLNIDKCFVSNLREGYGKIRTRVGYLPIPTPAVKNVVDRFGAVLERVELPYELITPTGISALAVITNFKNIDLEEDKIIKRGYGRGKRNYNTPCTLKIILFK